MCKVVQNTKIKKIIILLLVLLLLFNIFPKKVQAKSLLYAMGGTIVDAALELLVFLGDAVLNILQQNFISTENIVIQAQSEELRSTNALDVLMVLIGIIGIVAGILISVASFGSLSFVGAAAIATSIKVISGVLIVSSLGVASVVAGGSRYD